MVTKIATSLSAKPLYPAKEIGKRQRGHGTEARPLRIIKPPVIVLVDTEEWSPEEHI